ncbi:hypothetical protein K8R33_03900, partial [archaeon]|nr:hypothetical protein [archaeon]
MADLIYKIRQEYENLKVNRQFPEFLKRASDINSHLKKGESLVVRHETRDSSGRFGMCEDIEMIVLYRIKDGRKERALQLDVTGLLVDDDLYKSNK